MRNGGIVTDENKSNNELIRRSDAELMLAKHFDILNGDMRQNASVASLILARSILSECETVETLKE